MTPNTIFLYDASTGDLLITTVPTIEDDPQGDYEQAVIEVAEAHDMRFKNCDWGSVGKITIENASVPNLI